MGRPWIAAGIVVATLLALGAQTSIVTRTGFFLGDFRAFYCAARVASQGANPYRTEPLSACERSILPAAFYQKHPGVTIPAPLPGYAIAALIPFSLLPFGVAATLWVALLLLAWFACVATLTRFAGITWEMSLATFALSLGALSLPFGEVVPLAVGCTCVAAYAAWSGRWRLAAIFAAGAMIEPHLGLPVCLGLAIWAPPTRWLLAVCFVALAALSFGFLGPSVNLEYFSSVLPAHALSEVTRDTQYSLSAILAAIGMAPGAALRAGALWYLAMLLGGIFVGGKLAKETRNPAFIVCVPPAFAVFGGSFIHITQIAAAVPAATLLACSAQARYRNASIVALLLLTIPWGWVVSPALIVAPFVPAAYLAWRFWEKNTRVVLLTGLAAAVMVFGLQHLYTLSGPHFGMQGIAPAIDPRLPEASWSGYSRAGSAGSLAAWAVRIPTWAGLALLVAMLVQQSRAFQVRAAFAPAVIVAILCTIVPIALQFGGDRASGWLGVDFRAYYCASLAQREHLNPYFVTSLHDCEASTPSPYYHVPPNVTVPAPYPPYVMALLSPLTLLPFPVAAVVWWIGLAIAIGLAACGLSAITGQVLSVALGALGLSLGLTSFSTGNMMPLGLTLIVVAALCVQRGRLAFAVVAATLAMVEPQIALPAALAFFIAYPAMRLRLAFGVALLGALAVVSGGWAQTLAFVTSVVPAHALAEVSRDNQYSLATIAAAAGVPDGTAVLIGSLSYVTMIAAGVLVAMRLARRYDEPAFVLLVPPAFSLLGGSFVHTAEIAAAVPAALLLFARASDYRGWLLASLVVLAVPWMNATSLALFLAPFFPVAYLVYVLWHRDRTLALGSALASCAVIAGLFHLAATSAGGSPAHAHAYPPIDPRLAEASWRSFVLNASTNNPVMWLLRLPTWLGLLLLAVPALLLASKHHVALSAQRVTLSTST
ncbi:MAG: glycosyltransferase family 87 protein [Candidatus Cybelea sp.]